ncbi:MAG: ethylbenzene dehydrogenase-related protein [Chloroflexia bacterium]
MAAFGAVVKRTDEGLRLTAKGRALAMFSVVLAVGFALAAFNVPLASSAANSVKVHHIAQEAPHDPQSPLWEQAEESEIPLSAQQMQQPGGGATRSVLVRAIDDGITFSIRVSWDDDTKNDAVGNLPSDAAAIQLPIDPQHLPYQCMGQSNSRVNIWQWKAALEKEAGENLTVTSMEGGGARNLTSNGICKAVETNGVGPAAKSYHDGKQWHVVYWRKLYQGDLVTAPIIRETSTSIAFAVWNGARGETRGMKAVSTWNTLAFETPPVSPTGGLITLAGVVLASVVVVGWAMRRYSR